MPGIVHFLLGAFIIQELNIYLAVFLIIVFHFVIDFIPHQDYSIYNLRRRIWKKAVIDIFKVSIDVLLGIFIVISFADNIPLALLGGFISIMPDVLDLGHYMFLKNKLLRAIYYFHNNIVHCLDKKTPSYIKIFNTALFIVVSVLLQILP